MAQKHETGLVICVTGPESTGKTTLATRLAEALAAPLVEEVARTWLTERAIAQGAAPAGVAPEAGLQRYEYGPADVLEIARAQFDAEAAALRSGAPVVVADTDLTVIRVWWEERFGELDPWIADALGRLAPRRYLLTLPDIPWEPDPLRESPLDRERLLERYRAVLAELAVPHAEIGGSGPIRLQRAFAAVRSWVRVGPGLEPEQPAPEQS
jgi:nicotinamide riboside kinase